MTGTTLTIDFAGEVTELTPGQVFTVGREGTLALDDNPYLHRHFLEIAWHGDLWWVANLGTRIPAGLTDDQGLMRSTLAPGARLPIVFDRTSLTFGAGGTSYELLLEGRARAYCPVPVRRHLGGDTTITPAGFTESQLQAILALAEPVLRRRGSGASSVPTAVEAAQRLGWSQTRFNRKLDNVCEKLTNAGVSGLRGSVSSTATNRRVRLVEYAVSTLLVTAADLRLLDGTRTTTAGDSA